MPKLSENTASVPNVFGRVVRAIHSRAKHWSGSSLVLWLVLAFPPLIQALDPRSDHGYSLQDRLQVKLVDTDALAQEANEIG